MEEFWRIMTLGLSRDQRGVVVRTLLDIFLVLAILAAYGFFSIGGFHGFAQATDVMELRQAQNKAAVEILEQRIFETRVRQCQAGTEEARRFYSEKLQELLSKFRDLTHGEYGRMPDCREL